jgi:hypothetical protein
MFLKQGLRHRTLRDMDDVINLLLANRIDLRQEIWRKVFMKYGSPDLYEKSPEPSRPESSFLLHDRSVDGPELELPNAPDFISRRSPMTLAQVLPLLEERRKMFPGSGRTLPRHWRQPVDAEFIL